MIVLDLLLVALYMHFALAHHIGVCKPSLVFLHEPLFAMMLLGAATCPLSTFTVFFFARSASVE